MLSLFFDASAVVQPCSSSRRTPDPLLASRFRDRFPPRLLTGMTSRWFGLPACTASPEGLPPSLAQHGSQNDLLHRLAFLEDTRARSRSPAPASKWYGSDRLGRCRGSRSCSAHLGFRPRRSATAAAVDRLLGCSRRA